MGMKIREMTLDGLTLIARGGTGDCWRIDDETLLKLLRFERLYGDRSGTPAYHEKIRKEVIARWETT